MAAPALKRAVEELRTSQTPTSPDLKEWWTSGERVSAGTTRSILLGLAAVSALAGALTATAALPFSMAPAPGPVRLSVAAALWLGAPVLALSGMWRHGTVKSDFMRRYQRQKIYHAIDDIATDPEFRTFVRLNPARIDADQELTLSQAAHAYRNTQIAMTVGFVLLASGAATALMVHGDPAGQAVVGGLAAIGTALSGFIVATFLRAQRDALSQLNVYFRQPLTTSYLLTAERWAMKLPSETRPGTFGHMADQLVAQAFGPPKTGSHDARRGDTKAPAQPTSDAVPPPAPSLTAELAALAGVLGQPAVSSVAG